MNDFSRYESRNGRRPRVSPSGTTTVSRPPRDRDECPAGWDQDIWHLVLRFEQYAQTDGIRLHARRPVIYAEILDLVDRHQLRGKTYLHEVYRCDRRHLSPRLAARCWYHWPPDDPDRQQAGDLTWVQMAEVIMAEFWSRIQDEHTASAFHQLFQEYGQATVNHWRNLRILKDIDSQPHVKREPMRRLSTQAATGK